MEKEELIKLLDFLDNTAMEIHIKENGQVLVFMHFFNIEDFVKMFDHDYFYEGGVDCVLCPEYIVVDLQDFLENEDLEIIRNRYKEES